MNQSGVLFWSIVGRWRISQSGLAVSSVEFLNRPLKIKHHIIMQKGVLPEDPGDVLALARAFINSASPSGYEKNMGEVITDRLKMTGWEVMECLGLGLVSHLWCPGRDL